ncbi:MAG: Cd(II)/Pb(II)-responsive transcriptional regulator [Mailhella sp.]|nr:Cd(II)/Pb(II)-responsive transcriptional regulator [Mailhella sp.]
MSLKIGDLAKAADIPAVTIRYYEKEGLMRDPERTGSGYRLYSESDVERLHFIRRCRLHGMNLAEIRDLLAFRDDPAPSCDWINALVERHIANVQEQIESLQHLKRHLEALRSTCTGDHSKGCGIIAKLDHGAPCPCCEGLHCRLERRPPDKD